MATEEKDRLIGRIKEEFRAIVDNGNSGSALFWDITIVADILTSEIRQSYMANKITRAEYDEIRVFFNAHMEEIADIRLKENSQEVA